MKKIWGLMICICVSICVSMTAMAGAMDSVLAVLGFATGHVQESAAEPESAEVPETFPEPEPVQVPEPIQVTEPIQEPEPIREPVQPEDSVVTPRDAADPVQPEDSVVTPRDAAEPVQPEDSVVTPRDTVDPVQTAESQQGESEGGDSAQGPGGEAQVAEPEGPRIPGEAPVSTTADAYGYVETDFDPDTASGAAIVVATGEQTVNGAQILYWGGSAVQNSGRGRVVIRNSYIRGETALETAPLSGNPGNLLVAGNIRTTLGLGNSQSFYINSTIVSRNWAVLSTDGAAPAQEPGEKELSLYAYGSEAIAQDGGYGAYSDLFCNLYSYGSHFQSAEIGIISGTYGRVTIGTSADGESDPEMAAVLTEDDKARRQFKQPGSVIEGGRNAIMIHSVNLPPYWEYEGYSQAEIPLLSADISARESTLATNLSLDRGVSYEPAKAAYISHTKGSVILIKSTNVNMILDGCRVLPDAAGTGYLIQTVYNNDTMFMNAVPDGAYYPGIDITMKNMEAEGDIAHEDYQRDFSLTLKDAVLTGAVNEYDCEHWNQCAAREGFTDYALDAGYSTHHGIEVKISDNATWNVTKDSRISSLMIGASGKVNGDIYVNGELMENAPNTVYSGDVLVTPFELISNPEPGQEQDTPQDQQDTSQDQDPRGGNIPQWNEGEDHGYYFTDPDTAPDWAKEDPNYPGFEPDPEAGRGPEETEHVHNWVRRNGGYPADCVYDGLITYVCSICGEEYDEILPALAPAEGHIYEAIEYVPPTCYSDGYCLYQCPRCLETFRDYFPATGHDWVYSYHVDATCGSYGYDVYYCNNCGEVEFFDYDLYPPTYEHNFTIVYPTPWQPSLTHTWECEDCGATYEEYHTGDYECYCGWVGAVG